MKMKYARVLLAISLAGMLIAAFDRRVAGADCSYNCWNVVPSPNLGGVDNRLFAVTAITSSDAWAVAYYGQGAHDKTLTLHWDGARWSQVASPSPSARVKRLYGVAAFATDDVWAVGEQSDGDYPIRTLILHYDGTSWSVVPSPNPGRKMSQLHGVVAISANDAWAIGDYYNLGAGYRTLTLHWDGETWSHIASPNPGSTFNTLNGIAAASARQVWAVGAAANGGGDQTLAMYWDGTNWNLVPSPSPSMVGNDLNSVVIVTKDDVWAVGVSAINTYVNRTLTLHWDGAKWSVVPSPNASPDNNELRSVASVQSNQVWSVGFYKNAQSIYQTLIERWDGENWAVEASQNSGSADNFLYGIVVVPDTSVTAGGDIWAVSCFLEVHKDWQTASKQWQTLIERYTLPPSCCP